MSKTEPKRRLRPAMTAEAREKQLIALSVDLVERRLLEGTATSQEIVHFLKLGTVRAELEKKELEEKIKLLEAKTEMIKSAKVHEELYGEALAAMRSYQGLDNASGQNSNIQ